MADSVPAKFDVSPTTEDNGIKPNLNYIRTIPAILKAIEFMLFLLAMIISGSFKNAVPSYVDRSWNSVNFFIAIMVLCWLGTLLLFLVYFMNIISKLKNIKFIFVILGVLHLIGAAFLLISSALAFDDCLDLRKHKQVCKALSKADANCSAYEAAAAFGFFGFIAVLFDAGLHLMKGFHEFRIQRASPGAGAEPNIDG